MWVHGRWRALIVYIGLLSIMFIACFSNPTKSENSHFVKQDRRLWFIYIIITLTFALRASSVGRDLPGYERIYNLTTSIEWCNFNYVYFEKGYIFLMKVCSLFGLEFQSFLAVCAVLTLFPVYLFINRYSDNKYLSIFIFFSYMYFEFALTAVRQAISMSIALIGFMVLASSVKRKYLYYIAIIYVASLFHKGALICYLILPFLAVKSISLYTVLVVGCGAIGLILRPFVLRYIKDYFEKDTFNENAELYIGLNFVFLIIISAWFILVLTKKEKKNAEQSISIEDDSNILFFKLFLLSIMIALFFGKETSARSYMYYNQTIIILIPNCLKMTKMQKKQTLEVFILAFFASFFAWNTLSKNNFDIVPYRFFWQR